MTSMDLTFWRWAVGLTVSLVVGHFVTGWAVKLLRLYLTKQTKIDDEAGIPVCILGSLERFFFLLIVAFKVSGAAVAMMIWITVKMATHWRPEVDKDLGRMLGAFPRTSLFGSFLSMFFALVGGLICRG